MAESVGVFLDYENVHRTGHNLFEPYGRPTYETVINPIKLAERLVAKRSRQSTLAGVWVYRGRPVPMHQPVAASANDIQADAWSSDPRVHLLRRDLKYEWPYEDDSTFLAREKGIDVALAVGLTERALNQEFDAAVVFSGDTDLLPALELVFGKRLLSLEIAAWVGQKPLWFPDLLNATPSRKLPYCHFLTQQDFADSRDYSVPLP